ncbi:MAG: multicopper oxidase domain-containing protein [Nitrospirae bacterium]|nr:multicopper oxidase domain-containing protein [Nitrospirota bacterium]
MIPFRLYADSHRRHFYASNAKSEWIKGVNPAVKEAKGNKLNRRDFLRAGVLGTAAFSISGLTRALPRQGTAAVIDVSFVAERVVKSMIDGTPIPVWQFRDPAGSGPGDLESGLLVEEGDTINITVQNDLDRPINFVVPGVFVGTPAVAAGSKRLYSFQAPAAGSYFYSDDVNGESARAMGLSGPLVVMPQGAPNQLYAGGPTFDRQYTLVLNELDDRLNDALDNGQPFDMAGFEPNYFFANGLSYPDTAADADTLVSMNQGEDIALRLINAGVITNPMHFHGYHVEVATRNRTPETVVVDKDTVLVDREECVDVILPVTQSGAFPLHTHFVPGVTANGVYVNPYGGALIVMTAV